MSHVIPSAPDERGPFTASLRTSVGLAPRWLAYAGVSAYAYAIAGALLDLATASPHGAPELDREYLAYAAGLGRADKVGPYLEELVDVGFVSVLRSAASGGVRRPDHFDLALEAPAGYGGPRAFVEFRAQFERDRQAVYEQARAAGRRPRAGRQSIARGAAGEAVPDFRGHAGQACPRLAGTVSPTSGDTQVRPVPAKRGQLSPTSGDTQVSTVPDFRGQPSDRDREISEGEISRSLDSNDRPEPVPGGAAVPPATGQDERRAAAVLAVVTRLPWQQWARRQGTAWTGGLSGDHADELVAAITAAMTGHGLDLEQVTNVALAALSEARSNPVRYVTTAFEAGKLARRLRALAEVALDPEPLELPAQAVPAVAPVAVRAENPSATPATIAVASSDALLERARTGERGAWREVMAGLVDACTGCGARPGEPWHVRAAHDEDHNPLPLPCPDCLDRATSRRRNAA